MDAGDPDPVPSSLDPAACSRSARLEASFAPQDARRRSAVSLVLLLGLFVLAALVEASPERATLAGIEGPQCPSTHLLGEIGCPGCGLTRATAMVLDGEFGLATRLQPAAWLVLAVAAVAAAAHTCTVVTGRTAAWNGRLLRSARVVLLSGLLLVWLARLA